MPDVLIIDDERDIAESVEYNLEKEGFTVSKAFDGNTGLKMAKDKNPSILLLDLMLPGISGLDVCRILKNDPKTANLPIIMLTAKSSEVDKIVGLELGADDYITKPFSMRELIVRIKTILKRYGVKPEKAQPNKLKIHELEIDSDKHEVKVGSRRLELTAKEFALLHYLAENKDKVFSREKLLDTVWGVEVAIETRTVDVHVRRLREKLGKAGKYIQTLRGVGYKFHA